MIDNSTMQLLEDKLSELAGDKIPESNLDEVTGTVLDFHWPFNVSFDKVTPEIWEILKSKHLTALHTLTALKNEVAVLTEVIQKSN